MTSFFRLAFFLIIISQAVICCSGSDNEKKSSPTDISVPEHFLSEIISDNHIVAEVGDHVDLTANGPYSFEWSLLSRPELSTCALSNETSPNPSITIDAEGFYYIEVDAYNGDTYIGSDYANISTASMIHYVREGAGGSNDGSDWTNAYASLPADLSRGHTYYLADGNYGAYDFDDVEDGAKPIFILKATDADHGPASGWNPGYGAGQAVFGTWMISRSYYYIDGQTGGGPGNWQGGTQNFGFRAYSTDEVVYFRGPSDWQVDLPRYICFKHIDLEGGGTDLLQPVDIVKSISAREDGADGPAQIYFGYCYIHDAPRMMINTTNTINWVVEYNYFARNHSDAVYHAEAWQAQGGKNILFRYNIMEDIEGTAFIAIKKNSNQDHDNWKIYGNIFFNSPGFSSGIGGNGAIGVSAGGTTNTSITSNIKVYHNTFYNIDGYNTGIYLMERGEGTPKNNYAYNNVWVNCGPISHTGITSDYNDYYDSVLHDPLAAASNERVLIGDPLNADFTLAAPTDSGKSDIGDLYRTDMLGEIRGGDGIWDRGALEY
ncbi:MAG: hypothetical protein PVH87_05270 [Desulfobacteraceae bacterium]|jgi:hypothetical protein